MGIKTSRLLILLCLIWVIYWNVNKMVIGYGLFMWASSELLNSKATYRLIPYYKLYNAMFIGLLLFTTIDRSRHFVIMSTLEYTINAIEHFLFTSIICLKICIYCVLFYKKQVKRLVFVVAAALAFNAIGLANEFYQNYFKNHSDLWAIDFESQIDLLVNLVSSIIFIVLAYCFPKYYPKRIV